MEGERPQARAPTKTAPRTKRHVERNNGQWSDGNWERVLRARKSDDAVPKRDRSHANRAHPGRRSGRGWRPNAHAAARRGNFRHTILGAGPMGKTRPERCPPSSASPSAPST